ncbi:hypothetical protein [Phenylobacterium sp.]|uniref:hypothetical protein n=1 Tax=Phenylobacterium sp. TaxID=1871053 RepID=UPI0025E4A34A|nr:hypothetical protein [Phenylobacterium sp.]
MWLVRALIGALALLSVIVALAPEPAPEPIPGLQLKVLTGRPGAISLSEVRDRDRTAPTAVLNYQLLRSWTPEGGVRPLKLEFGPLPHGGYLGVLYQGSIDDPEHLNDLYLRCSSTDRVKAVAIGGVNTTVTETIVRLDRNWCADGEIYLRLVGGSMRNIGVAPPYSRSPIAYLKQSYLGYVGFFLVAFAGLLGPFFAGGLAARLSTRGLDPVLGGLLGVGAASLLAFYVYACTPIPAPSGLAAPAFFALVALFAWRRAPVLARSVWRAQRGAVMAWFAVGLLVVSILHLASVGAGAWEPAYRFSPAVWSSDHTLPMLLAEVARIGALPQEGLMGGWSLSDRPPLMAGAYLLSADLLRILQLNNDGPYLQPIALGVGGVAASALWAAALYWAVQRAAALGPRIAALAVVAVAATPFALFNTGYTWPKLFGAAFSLAAAAYVFRRRAITTTGEASVFGGLAGLALLSHAASAFFLTPVALVYFAGRLWKSPKAVLVGAAVGLALLATWAAFKALVLPSHDPLLAYALTGHLVLEPTPLLQRLAERYDGLDVISWVRAKLEVASYLLTPAPPPGPLPLERPPSMPAGDLSAKLRFWDFYALSAGNSPLLLLGAVGLIGAFFARQPSIRRMSGRLILATLGCYVLFVTATFLPLFIHQFSYDAILAMALAGIVVAAGRPVGRAFLLVLAAAGAIYTGLVWGLAPLASARTIDLAGVAVTALLLGASLSAGLRPSAGPARAGVLAASIALVSVLSLTLAWRPDVFIVERPPGPPKARNGVCLGTFDQVIQQKDGAWQAFGWAWDVSAAAPVRLVRVFDAGTPLGVADTGQERPDVSAAIPEVSSAKSGWTLGLAARPSRPRAEAILSDGAVCDIGRAAR